MSEKQTFDVVVIGAGPGGYVSAIRAAQLGFNVAIVERENLGGICLNWGCIPTKALLKASEVLHSIKHAEEFGITVGTPKIDFKKIIQRSRNVAGQLSSGIGFLMKKNKITVLNGSAVFKNDKEIIVTTPDGKENKIGFAYAIVATGARAKEIPGVLEKSEHVWTYREAMTPKELPKSLLVIGSGAIGVEFASFYNELGVNVTIVEAQDRIVPVEDKEISAALEKQLTKKGMTILTGAKVKGLESTDKKAKAIINGEKQAFDKAILAIGISPNVETLNLEVMKIRAENGAIPHDEMYRTARENIYVIGDVAGAPWLAHVASHEGVIAAEHIASLHGKHAAPHAMDYANIPGCTYCAPQIGSTGLTEEAAKAAGHTIKVGRFNYQANGKALAIGEPEGFVKTIFDATTGELLGAHIIGAEATEMITTFVLGKHMEAVEEDFQSACLPHPTLNEMILEASLSADGRELNS